MGQPVKLRVSNVPTLVGAGSASWDGAIASKSRDFAGWLTYKLKKGCCSILRRPFVEHAIERVGDSYQATRFGEAGHRHLVDPLEVRTPQQTASRPLTSRRIVIAPRLPEKPSPAVISPAPTGSVQEQIAPLVQRPLSSDFVSGGFNTLDEMTIASQRCKEALHDVDALARQINLLAKDEHTKALDRITSRLIGAWLPRAGALHAMLAETPPENTLCQTLTDCTGATAIEIERRLRDLTARGNDFVITVPDADVEATAIAEGGKARNAAEAQVTVEKNEQIAAAGPKAQREAEAGVRSNAQLAKLLQSIRSNVLNLQKRGLLTNKVVFLLANVQGLSYWSVSEEGIDHLQALIAFAALLHSLTRGCAGTIDRVLGCDNENDDLRVALKLGECCSPDRAERIRLEQEITSARRVLARSFGSCVEASPHVEFEPRVIAAMTTCNKESSRSKNLLVAEVLLKEKKLERLNGTVQKWENEKAKARNQYESAFWDLPAELQGKLLSPEHFWQWLNQGTNRDTLIQAIEAEKAVYEARQAWQALTNHPDQKVDKEAVLALLNAGIGQLAKDANKSLRNPSLGAEQWLPALEQVEAHREKVAAKAREDLEAKILRPLIETRVGELASIPMKDRDEVENGLKHWIRLGLNAPDLKQLSPLLEAWRHFDETQQQIALSENKNWLGLSGQCAAEAGLSVKELDELYKKVAAGQDISETKSGKLISQGFVSTHAVQKANKLHNKIANIIFKDWTAHLTHKLSRYGIRPALEAGAHRFLDTVSSAVTRVLVPNGANMEVSPFDRDYALREHFQPLATIRFSDELIKRAADNRGEMSAKLSALRQMDENRRKYHSVIPKMAFNAKQDGVHIEAVANAQLLLKAAKLWKLETYATGHFPHAPKLSASDKARMDEIVRSLRAMDKRSLRNAPPALFQGKERIGTAEQLWTFLTDNNAANWQMAQAVVAAVHMVADRKQEHAELVKVLDDRAKILDERRQAIEAAEVNPTLLISAVRYAVLEQGLQWPDGLAKFDAVAHRSDIEKRLKDGWGIHPEVFEPEIAEVLYHSLDSETLRHWTKEVEDQLQQQSASVPRAVGRFFHDRSEKDPVAERAFLDSVKNMDAGNSITLTRGWHIDYKTPKVFVEPTGTGCIWGEGQMNTSASLTVRRTNDGFEVLLKDGVDGIGKFGLGASLWGLIRIGAALGIGGSNATGVACTFAGEKEVLQFLSSLCKGQCSPDTIALADMIALVHSDSKKMSGQIEGFTTLRSISTGLQGLGVSAPDFAIRGLLGGVTFEVAPGSYGKVAVSGEWVTDERVNSKERIVEKTFLKVLERQFSGGLFAVAPTVQDSVANHLLEGVVGTPFGAFFRDSPAKLWLSRLLTATTSSKLITSKTARLAYGRDDLLLPTGNTFKRSVPIGEKTDLNRLLEMLGPVPSNTRNQLNALKAAVDELKMVEENRTHLETLLSAAAPGDSVVATYTLSKTIRDQINMHLVTAQCQRETAATFWRQAYGKQARAWEKAAEQSLAAAMALYEDEANFEPDTIAVVKSCDTDLSTTLFGFSLLSIGRIALAGVEWPALIFAFPHGASAEGALQGHKAEPPREREATPRDITAA